jgi:hypothetical protein
MIGTVEIVDVAVTEPSLQVIAPDDSNVIEAWQNAQKEVFGMIEKTEWIAIDVLWQTRGRARPIRKPALMISAADAEEPIWDTVLPLLNSAVGRFFDIEIRELRALHNATSGTYDDAATALTASAPEDHPMTLSVDSYDRCITMGASVGVAGTDRSGTMGMRMKLQSHEAAVARRTGSRLFRAY